MNYAYECYRYNMKQSSHIDLIIYNATDLPFSRANTYHFCGSIRNACRSYEMEYTLGNDILLALPLRKLLLSVARR